MFDTLCPPYVPTDTLSLSSSSDKVDVYSVSHRRRNEISQTGTETHVTVDPWSGDKSDRHHHPSRPAYLLPTEDFGTLRGILGDFVTRVWIHFRLRYRPWGLWGFGRIGRVRV